MKPLSPRDASILALIAENPGMSIERMNRLVDLADDREEVLSVAKALLNGQNLNGSAPSQQIQESAEALKLWVRENRKPQPA